jgi:hypothetical protein
VTGARFKHVKTCRG